MGAPYPSGLVGILLPTGLLGYAYANICSPSIPTGLVDYQSFSDENNGASKRRTGPHTPSRSKTGSRIQQRSIKRTYSFFLWKLALA